MSALLRQREPAQIFARVAEMVDSEVGNLLALDPGYLTDLTTGDTDPQFVIVRVEEGKSGNGRIWPAHVLESVVKQVNDDGLPGYKGHIPDEVYGTLFPPTQTRWLKGATRKEEGKTVAYFKGYNLPGREIRDEVKHRLARTVSWIGNAGLKAVKGGYEVVEFVADSLDWSRPGAEGMSARVVTVAAEMKGGGKVGLEATEVAVITERDLETHNPNLVRVMEMRGEQKTQTRIQEMEETVKQAKTDIDIVDKLLKLLGLEKKDDILDNIATLHKSVTDLASERTKQAVRGALEKMFPNEDQRQLVSQFGLVQEMKVEGDTPEARIEDAEKKLKEGLDTNETVRKLVGEMQSEQGGPNLDGKGQESRTSSDGKYKVGSETSNVVVGRASL